MPLDERWFNACGVCGWKPERPNELREMEIRVRPGAREIPDWGSPMDGRILLQSWKCGETTGYRLFVCEECAKAAAEAWRK